MQVSILCGQVSLSPVKVGLVTIMHEEIVVVDMTKIGKEGGLTAGLDLLELFSGVMQELFVLASNAGNPKMCSHFDNSLNGIHQGKKVDLAGLKGQPGGNATGSFVKGFAPLQELQMKVRLFLYAAQFGEMLENHSLSSTPRYQQSQCGRL